MNFNIKPLTFALLFLPFLAFAQSDYLNFKSAEGAFSIDLPTKPRTSILQKDIPFEEWTETIPLYIFQSTDLANSSSYVVRYNEVSTRGMILDFNEAFANQIQALKNIWGEPTVLPKNANQGKFPAQRLVFKVKNIEVFVKIILRGKRMYLLMAEVSSSTKNRSIISDFFESFTLLPFEKTVLQPIQLPDTERLLSFPNQYVVDTAVDLSYPQLSEYEFTAIDSLNGNTYKSIFWEYSPYFESEEGDSFLTKAYQNICLNKKLKFCRDTIFQGTKAIYLQFDYDSVNMSSYNLIFSKGNYIIELIAQMPLKFGDKTAWDYFNSYLDNTKYPEGCFLTDRTNFLLKDLQTTDTLLRDKAKLEIYNHTFSPDELMGIYQVLENELPEDKSGLHTVRELLIQELGKYTYDISTFPFLKKLYAKKTTSPQERILILEAFANFKSIDSFTSLFELITNWDENINENIDYADVFYPLTDTLDLTLQFYPQLLEIKTRPSFQEDVLNVIYRLKLGENLSQEIFDIQRDFFVESIENIIQKNGLNVPLDTLPEMKEYRRLKILIRLLSELSSDKTIGEILVPLNNLPDEYLQLSIIDALLIHGLKPTKVSYQFVAKSPYYWYDLLKDLKYENRLDNAPKKLRTPELTVESRATNYLTKEYGALETFKILGKAAYSYQGKTVNLYRFKFSVKNYTGSYFGVCSQPNDGQMKVYPEIFDYSTTELTKEDANLEEVYEGIMSGWK